MIDLHTHTWHSDGILSPAALVQEAAEKGIRTLSITDHDGTDGLSEGGAEARARGIRFINGVEFSAVFTGGTKSISGNIYMHILGYDFDPQNKELTEALEEIREQRKERNALMLRTLSEMGYPLCREDIEVYPGQDYIGKPNFARALVNRGYAASVPEAFASEKLLASPRIKEIHRKKIGADRAVRLVRRAGGFTVLAHPFQVSYPGKREDEPRAFRKKLAEIVTALKTLGLSGIECYYSTHTPEQESFLLSLAELYQMKVTAGSDYHGPGMKKNTVLGGVHGGQYQQG